MVNVHALALAFINSILPLLSLKAILSLVNDKAAHLYRSVPIVTELPAEVSFAVVCAT